MLKVRYNPKWCEDSPIEYAIRYTDEQFSELSKVWADLGLELLVHKQEVDPMIDIIQRDEDGLIVYAMTIRVGDWFKVDPVDNDGTLFLTRSLQKDTLSLKRRHLVYKLDSTWEVL